MKLLQKYLGITLFFGASMVQADSTSISPLTVNPTSSHGYVLATGIIPGKEGTNPMDRTLAITVSRCPKNMAPYITLAVYATNVWKTEHMRYLNVSQKAITRNTADTQYVVDFHQGVSVTAGEYRGVSLSWALYCIPDFSSTVTPD